MYISWVYIECNTFFVFNFKYISNKSQLSHKNTTNLHVTSFGVTAVALLPPTQPFITVQSFPPQENPVNYANNNISIHLSGPGVFPWQSQQKQRQHSDGIRWNNDDVDDVESILSAIYAQREEKGKINDNLLFIPECVCLCVPWKCLSLSLTCFVAVIERDEMKWERKSLRGGKAHLLV